MSFGWSAGDILAAAEFILEVARALDEVDGAAKEFRTASTFLRNLNSALTPLEAFSALDTRPAYKHDIEREVKAIRKPVEAFIDDVKGLQKSLGVEKEGRFRHFQNIPSKLKWHFSTAKKALALQKEVDLHLKIIDTLMQRLTVDMLHSMETEPKLDVGKALEDKLSAHLPALQTDLLEELSQRDYSSQAAWQAELKIMLEDLLERYFGSQKVTLSTRADQPVHISSSFSSHLDTLKSRYQRDKIERCRYPVVGITDDPEVTTRMQQWWATPASEWLWVQTSHESLASSTLALAYAADVPFAAYFCERILPDGTIPDPLDNFINLVYSLIYQMASAVQENSIPVFSSTQWEAFDASKETIATILEILRGLVDQVSGRLLVVIEAMDILDYSGDPVLQEHIKTLFEVIRSSSGKGLIKFLLITTNHSEMILDELGWENTVDASFSSVSDGFFPLEDFTAADRRRL